MRSKRSNLEARSLRVEQVMAGLVDERADGSGRANREDRRRDRSVAEAGNQRPLEAERFDQRGDVVCEQRERDLMLAHGHF